MPPSPPRRTDDHDVGVVLARNGAQFASDVAGPPDQHPRPRRGPEDVLDPTLQFRRTRTVTEGRDGSSQMGEPT